LAFFDWSKQASGKKTQQLGVKIQKSAGVMSLQNVGLKRIEGEKNG